MSDPPETSPIPSDEIRPKGHSGWSPSRRKGGSPSALATLAGCLEIILVLLVLVAIRLLVMRFSGA